MWKNGEMCLVISTIGGIISCLNGHSQLIDCYSEEIFSEESFLSLILPTIY